MSTNTLTTRSYGVLVGAFLLLMVLLSAATPPVQATTAVFINELHYDNNGADTGEGVEVAGLAGTDLSGWRLVAYNGGDNGVYRTKTLSGAIPELQDGCGAVFFAISGLQNGAPDAIALVDDGDSVIQFLSYEGVLTAVGGPADGMTSVDIGVDESDATPVGHSLQLGGEGATADAFSWQSAAASTYDAVNVNQTFTCGGGGDPANEDVLINEVDADTLSTDMAEFIELYDGGAGLTALDGLVIVFFDGNDDASYAAYDLDGQTTNADGFFVLGNSGVANVALTFAANSLQNGADAVALYRGNATDFPNNTPVTATDLQDALVYDTDDDDDDGLIAILTPGQEQIDEDGRNEREQQSNSRCPDGAGGAFNTAQYDQTTPTPGATNADCLVCGDPATPIHSLQGSGATSPEVGNSHTIEGVVVGAFQTSSHLGGFFVQEEDGDTDSDSATSEGIFVADGSSPVISVAAGEVVRVVGTVEEEDDRTLPTDGTLTQLSLTRIRVCGTGSSVTPASVTLPETTVGELEQFEGMLVTVTTPLTIAQNFFLGRYGQMTLSGSGRLYQPTQRYNPHTQLMDIDGQRDLIDRSILILDDGMARDRCGDNPDPVPYLGGPPPAVIRAGDTVTDLTGVLDYGQIDSGETGSCVDAATLFSGDYRLQPIQPPTFGSVNVRPAVPDTVGGRLKVASFNVLNYFTTIDTGAYICGPNGGLNCRGADSATEFIRQRDKIVAALCAIDAAVVGLMELENPNPANDPAPADGIDNYVVKDLVAALNAAASTCPDKTYSFVDTAATGTDAIRVDFIYKSSMVTPVGTAAVLTDSAFTSPFGGIQRNRPAVAQTFAESSSGERFTAVVNHLKSKGSDCGGVPDDDPLQGNCNGTRTAGAAYLAGEWLPTDPTHSDDPDVLILGDHNAYAQEDPIMALTGAGYTNLIEAAHGDTAYGYIFDGLSGYLDYALANAALAAQVIGVTDWHINTDEPAVIDYDEDYNPAGYYAPDAYRASDHDPVVVGLNLSSEPSFGVYLPFVVSD